MFLSRYFSPIVSNYCGKYHLTEILCCIRSGSARRPSPKAAASNIIYSPSPSNRPQPLPREGLATATLKGFTSGSNASSPRLTQSARARLGGTAVGVAPLLSFADSQDTLTDVLTSASLTRSVAVAPLPLSARTALKVRSVAPPPRPLQFRARSGRPAPSGGVKLALYDYSDTPVHQGAILGSFGR